MAVQAWSRNLLVETWPIMSWIARLRPNLPCLVKSFNLPWLVRPNLWPHVYLKFDAPPNSADKYVQFHLHIKKIKSYQHSRHALKVSYSLWRKVRSIDFKEQILLILALRVWFSVKISVILINYMIKIICFLPKISGR